jgi:hypothetical protein
MITYEKAISNEMVEEKIRQLKPIHPELAAVAERIHEMDLKETVRTIIAADALEALLKVHAMCEARGKAFTDEMAQQIVNELRPSLQSSLLLLKEDIRWIYVRLLPR